MNECLPRRLPVLALLAMLLVAACQRGGDGAPLAGASMGGPFTLTSHDGRRVSDTDFVGKYRIVYFGFTHCPDVCPTDMAAISAGLRQFERADPARAAKVQPIMITVDPARDTPDAMRQYVAAFHPRLIGLTGSEEEIAAVASAYGAYRSLAPPAADGAYLVDHSRNAVLYGPDGAPIVALAQDEGPAAVSAELDRWVR